MKWEKYTIKTTTAAEDFISAMLYDLGIQGVEIEDNVPLSQSDQAGMFIDFLPELPPDLGEGLVSFYLEEGEGQAGILEKVRAGIEEQRQFVDVGEGSISACVTEDADWIDNWKQYFHSFSIGDILIKPTWEELRREDEGRLVIEIDPGVSFGTGKHETTQLCIRGLSKYIRGGEGYVPKTAHPKVLDVGCGSGILSIAALKLGAASVAGTDVDENCIVSTRKNMEVNRLAGKCTEFYLGNLIDDAGLREKVGTGCFDLVVANILAEVLVAMMPVIPARLKEGGIFIASGIIDSKEGEVQNAVEKAGMRVLEINRQGEWACIVAEKG